MAMKKGLGKGLDSMIPEKKTKAEMKEAQDKSLAEIKISEIDPNMGQPRKKFDEDELLELAESIKIHGVIQPIILTKRGKRYEIIAGERRWRASKLAGLVKIPAVIREYTDKEIMEVSLIENIQRQDLNPIEEATAFKNLIDEYKMKQDDLAERVSKSRSAITNALRLLKLDDKVKAMLAEGLISTGHARALLAVEDKNKQQILATKIFDEKLSVRETEKLVKQIPENKEPKKEEKSSEKLIYKKLEDSLKSIIGSKVSIKGRDNGKGKIEIDYYSIEELDRITELLSTIKK
ncbi:putative stage 0 sporulation protein J [Catonella morbi ATCC 51271]|uniref:Putative stage 0 sporulation protein J n=1 Tax=Catonella morbi ATCC 51271 TaxID=592026 RepID=V2Z8V9_9FIRM|nr:ParB/RepB/Spo0J family partition protein [Catonella morbi]ESL03375.1 putative stage 0 sporulation protein J [Catonella morbi ATCC 51271]